MVTTVYDAANRVQAVQGAVPGQAATSYVSGATYAAHGDPVAFAYGNTLTRNYHYNSRLQPDSITDALGNNPNAYLFALSPAWAGSAGNNGNLQGLTVQAGGPGPLNSLPAYSQTFGYDGVNRLTSASDSGGAAQSYSYDANGNRWVNPGSFAPSGATPTSNVYDGQNRIVGGSYDAAGNQLVVNGDTLTHDAENRQTSATESPALGGAQELYVYDGDGQRVEKIAPAGNTIYVYDAFGQLAAEYNTFATAPPYQTCYLSADLIGSTRLVTDASGAVVSRHDFLPFGEEIPATAGRGSPWAVADNVSEQFTGQVRDAGTGLDYFHARYFSGALGRFTSPDPENAGADLTNPES